MRKGGEEKKTPESSGTCLPSQPDRGTAAAPADLEALAWKLVDSGPQVRELWMVAPVAKTKKSDVG